MDFLLKAAFSKRKRETLQKSDLHISSKSGAQRPPITFTKSPLFRKKHSAWSLIFEQGSTWGDPKTNINSSSRSNPDDQSMLIKIKINNCFFLNLVQMFQMFQIWPNSPKIWSMQGKTRHASVAWCPQIAFVSKTKTCLIFFANRNWKWYNEWT